MRIAMTGLLEPSVKIEIEIQSQEKSGDACPVATGDVEVNLENRQKAIDKANYGPMNPNEANMDYWREVSKTWRNSPDQARSLAVATVQLSSRPLRCSHVLNQV